MKKNILLLSLTLIMQVTAYSQSCVISKSFEGHSEFILGIAQSLNGKYILSGSKDEKAILWNEKGEIIFKKGDKGDELYIIESGTVRVFTGAEN